MNCPRCEVGLREGRFHDVPIDICTGCRGVLLEQRLLVRVLQRLVVDLSTTVDLAAPIVPMPDAGGIRCPKCSGVTDNYGYMGMRKVMIDRCSPCSVLWLDPNELGAIAKMYAQTNRTLDRRFEVRKSEMRESQQRMGMMTVARAVSNSLMMGMGAGIDWIGLEGD